MHNFFLPFFQILGFHRPSISRPFVRLIFQASLGERLIPAKSLVRDLSLLSLAELSAILHLPALRLDGRFLGAKKGGGQLANEKWGKSEMKNM
jgi:hypothetical protein